MALVAALLAAAPGFRDAQTSIVEVSGYAAVQTEDLPATRDRAIDDALRRAVEQALGARVTSTSVMRGYRLMSDSIVTEARGYVRRYEVLREARAGDVYEVGVRAEVAARALEGDLEGMLALLRLSGDPRILVLMDERRLTGPGKDPSARLAESTLAQAWLDLGAQVIDRVMLGEAAAGDGAQLWAAAQSAGVDLLVLGRATVTPLAVLPGSRVRAARATLTARVVDVGSSRILTTATTSRTGAHRDPARAGLEALEQASLALAGLLIARVSEHLTKKTTVATVTVKVTGLESVGDLAAVAAVFRERRGVQQVRQRSYVRGTGVLEVRVRGSGDELSRQLTGTKAAGGTLAVVEGAGSAFTVHVYR